MRTTSLTSQTTNPDNWGIGMDIERTDVDAGLPKLTELLGSVDLRAYNPIQHRRLCERKPSGFRDIAISNREQQMAQRTSPIVAMIAVYIKQR
jgi:hypothetical protein